MRHLRPSVIAVSTLLCVCAPAMAGPGGHAPAPRAHGPVAMPPKMGGGGGNPPVMRPMPPAPHAPAPMARAGDRLPPKPAPTVPQPQQVVLQPVFNGFASGVSYPYVRESELRPIVIEEPARPQPTQQIFINVPGGYHGYHGYRERQVRRPYAPPVIHIIGEPSRRHMRGPIHLTHGVKPGRRLATEPQVIWLKAASNAKGARVTVVKRAE